MTNPYDELSPRARWFMENFDECGIAEICASSEAEAEKAKAAVEALTARIAELEQQVATPAELDARQRRAWALNGQCPMCGWDDTDGRLCAECAATVRQLPAHQRRQWRRYEPAGDVTPVQGHGYTPAGLLGIDTAALDPQEQQPVTVHACPADGSGLTPCCGRTPFEMPGDRMTRDPALVTCPPQDRP